MFRGRFIEPVECKVLLQGRRQMCRLPGPDVKYFKVRFVTRLDWVKFESCG